MSANPNNIDWTFPVIDRSSPIPFYHQIKSHLRAQIESGELEQGEKLLSELDLAKRIDISPMTVRQAYKELEADGLVVRRRGRGTYVFSAAAVEPTPKKRGIDIGVLIPSLKDTDIFQSELLNGIESAAQALSYHTHLLSSNAKPLHDPQNYILHTVLDNRQIDGIIAMGVFRKEDIQYLDNSDIPFVFIDNDFKTASIHTVLLDDAGYVAAWLNPLLEAGIHEVALLCGERSTNASDVRRRGDRMVQGFRQAFHAAGLPCKEEWIFPGSGTEFERLKIAEKFLSDPSHPSTVLVNGDALTAALLHALDRHPELSKDNLTIINYGDSPHSLCCQAPKPLHQMGDTAVALLRKLIKKAPRVPHQVVVPFNPETIDLTKQVRPAQVG